MNYYFYKMVLLSYSIEKTSSITVQIEQNNSNDFKIYNIFLKSPCYSDVCKLNIYL